MIVLPDALDATLGIPQMIVPTPFDPRSRIGPLLPPLRVNTAPLARWRHGQDRSEPFGPRMPSGVANGVQTLFLAEDIGDSEVTASLRWYTDYVLGFEGVREGDGGSGGDMTDAMVARVVSVTRHREIAAILGAKMSAWLVGFVVDDLSLRAMSDRFWPGTNGRMHMRGSLVTLLIVLAGLYAGGDRHGWLTPQRSRESDLDS